MHNDLSIWSYMHLIEFHVNEKHIEKLTKEWTNLVETIDVDALVKRVTNAKGDVESQVQRLEETVSDYKQENKLLQEGLLNIPHLIFHVQFYC